MSGILLAHRAANAPHGAPMPPGNPAIGDAYYGGYYVGIIDTTKGNIIAADYFQVGQRFALILAPKSLENSSKKYKTADSSAPPQATTLWNGLDATASMNSASYPAAQYCAGLSYPSDGGSSWYLPAQDELEMIWRNLKPFAVNNDTMSMTVDFPPYSHASGDNPSSDPIGAAYTAAGEPFQTVATAFKTGGAQAMSSSFHWSATNSSYAQAWGQYFDSSLAGRQYSGAKGSSVYVRPVRRLILS